MSEMMRLLPSCTSFVLFHCHATSIAFHPHTLVSIRRSHGHEKHVLFHLSHEIAYDIESTSSWTYNCYGNESELTSYYKQYDLVVKQYYYDPLLQHSLYLPLGPRDYHELQQIKYQNGIKLIQQRIYLCTFSGRFSYDIPVPEHHERLEIENLIYSSSFPCLIIPSGRDIYGTPQLSRKDYLTLIGDSVFTPCPAGSATETFRLYEALELGSIPIIVRPRRAMLNYLERWKGYPGPVLNSWSEMSEYFDTLGLVDGHDICSTNNTMLKLCSVIDWNDLNRSKSVGDMTLTRLHRYLNILQDRIRRWYLSYKQSISKTVLDSLIEVFHPE